MDPNEPFRRPGRLTLEERTRGLSEPTPRRPKRSVPLDPAEDGAPPRTVPGQAKHCWIVDEPRWPGRWPALLAGWEQVESGWVGLVALSPPGSGSVLVTRVPARYLRDR